MAAGLLENEKGLIMVIIRDPRADSVLVGLKVWIQKLRRRQASRDLVQGENKWT